MMTLASLALLLSGLLPIVGEPVAIREGSSPQLALDGRGVIHMIFGRRDTIFHVSSRDRGATFSPAEIVAVVPSMHLGNTRGPVIASSRNQSMVTATDQAGNIHAFRLDHTSGRWSRLARPLNDTTGSAPEGLLGLTADDADGFHAAWLDIRKGRKNQIYAASLRANGAAWTTNVLAYASPGGSVCECCRPSIVVTKGGTAVMFRNSLGGARDMYVALSRDGGKTFAAPEKLGHGSWALNACPMDGGALAADPAGRLASVWRRQDSVFFVRPGEAEILVGNGRSPTMSVSPDGKGSYVIWQDGPSILLKLMDGPKPAVVGDGRLPQVLALPRGGVLTAWERAGMVYVRTM
jgi:hypothetical protein